jgi:hypothetical protein
VHLRAVDREHRNADQTGVGAERQHVAEQARKAFSWRWRKRAIVQ